MSQHTPGPWRISAANSSKIVTVGGEVVARAFDQGIDGTATFANARLIAKAPEMYQDLPYYLEWMELSHGKCDLNDDKDCYAEQYGDGSPEQHQRILSTRALLREIEGESA